jgi:cobyrinic acid a,c-diamide synthase
LLDLPVLLAIDCSHLSGSVAAIAQGYRSFDPRLQLAGVVLNRVGSDRHLELLKAALDAINVPILGVLRRQDAIAIPDRHLGLVPTAELSNLSALFDRLAALAATSFDWERLYPLLKIPSPASWATTRVAPTSINIAIARDRAFNFYYPDNLDILEQLGARLIPWSPIADSTLPEGTQGLYLGGGFPEVFAQALADNELARYSVRQAILAGMPAYAECGGLMYLCDRLVDFAGKAWSMAGILPTRAVMGKRLTLGYRRATVLQASWLFAAGEAVRGHEFHRSHLTASASQPLFELRTYPPHSQRSLEGWQLHQLHASYLHLHFGDYLAIPEKFLRSCLAFSKRVS